MTRISRFKLKDHVLEKLFDLFFEVVGKKKNKEEFNKIIKELLSHTERIMISKRIAIIYLLLKKVDSITIARVLKVSSATISKFNLLTQYSEAIVPTFDNMLKNERIVLFLEEVFNSLYRPGAPYIDWSSAWQRKKELSRKKKEGI